MPAFPSMEHISAPLVGRIRELERILRESPCWITIQESPEVMKLMGHGDRIMALEIKRLRRILDAHCIDY